MSLEVVLVVSHLADNSECILLLDLNESLRGLYKIGPYLPLVP